MAHPDYIRKKAIELRKKQKLSIDELSECLSISKTTIYYWVKDIEIPRKPGRGSTGRGFPSPAQQKGTKSMQEKYRKIREAAYKDGWHRYTILIQEPTFRDFICMYIGEGTKTRRNEVGICNSDPTVVALGHRWIKRLGKNQIDFGLQYHADQSPDELRMFWGTYLEIDPGLVKLQRKSNSKQLKHRRWRSEHGVLTVRMGDTEFRARLQAWMDRLRAEWH